MQEVKQLLLDRFYKIREEWSCENSGMLSEYIEFQVKRKRYHIVKHSNDVEVVYIMSHFIKITNWGIDIATHNKQELLEKIKTLKELKGR